MLEGQGQDSYKIYNMECDVHEVKFVKVNT